ncbi:MAG: tetratricopeptide repeat protein [Proteobacteria bacterium]|nr:tetratricopeptide repeat protein [Pseudomonadota bacterium]
MKIAAFFRLDNQFFALILIIGLATLAYSNTMQAPFVFDDSSNIVENKSLRINDLSLPSLKQAATQSPSGNRWLPNISFALHFYFTGMDVLPFHLGNLVIHILCAITLYFLILATLRLNVIEKGRNRAPELALFAALLWTLHPLATNAVTYLVQRMTSMMTLFYLLSILLYVCGRNQNQSPAKNVWFLLSMASGFMAIICKENAIMLPVTILAYEVFFLSDGKGISKKMSAGAGIAAVLCLLVVFGFLGTSDPLGSVLAGYQERSFTLGQRLLTEPGIILFYLSLLVLPLPSRLNINHDFVVSQGLFSPWYTVFSLAAFAGLLFMIVILFRKHRLLSFALLFFLINLVIESSIIPLELVYEHRLYLPTVFLIAAVVFYADIWFEDKRKTFRTVLIILCITLGILTWQRNTVWNSRVSLWSDVLNKSPNLTRAYTNLGWALNENKEYLQAEAILKRGLQDDANKNVNRESRAWQKDISQLHNVMGVVYRNLGNNQQALEHAKLALRYMSDSVEALLTLGISLVADGEYQQAEIIFEKVAKNRLETVDLYNNWGMNNFNLGNIDRAIYLLEHAVQLNPDHAESHYNLGIAYGSKGNSEKARQEMALGMRLMK